MSPARVVVVGDTLLDRDLVGDAERLAPDAPVPVLHDLEETARPGGAGLAAVLAAGDGRPVSLVTALAADGAGSRLAALLADAGVDVVDLGLAGSTPEKVRIRAGRHPVARLDRGGAPAPVGPLSEAGAAALSAADAVLVADYGRGVGAEPSVRAALAALPRRPPLVWDPHPRGATPVGGARLVTPNAAEAGLGRHAGLGEVTARGRQLATQWACRGVAVTLAGRGALLVEGAGPPLAVPAPPVPGGDACGAGDRFAVSAAGVLADGGLPSEAVTAAVADASAFVAAGGAAAVRVPPERVPAGRAGEAGDDAFAVVRRVRARGGTVVATGGCFDLVHAGHVSLLEAARTLGDCLVVCLNSDRSVRRLKGQGRPVQPEADRARVLLALGCVDAVTVFEEDTPEAVLDHLRPDVFAKGADYSLDTLPEAALVAGWGGQAVVLPYLQGRSTTRLVEDLTRRARP